MKTYIEQVEEEIALLPVDGCVGQASVRVWHRFNVYLVNLLEDCGAILRGYNFRMDRGLVLLVVKVTVDEAPLVAFVTAQRPTDCMSIFLVQLEERRVAWRTDRYA